MDYGIQFGTSPLCQTLHASLFLCVQILKTCIVYVKIIDKQFIT